MADSIKLFHLYISEICVATQTLETAILDPRVLIHDVILKNYVALVLLAA